MPVSCCATRRPPSGSTRGPEAARASRMWSRTASSSWTRSTRSPAAARAWRRRRRLPRGGPAGPAAPGGRQHRLHQAWRRSHRPYPVHRLRCLPPGATLGPDTRAAGPTAHPGGAQGPHHRGFRAYPHRARRLAHRPIRGPARHRGGQPGVHRGRHPPHRRDRLAGQRAHREHRRSAPAHGSWSACWRTSPTTRRTSTG